MQPLTRPSGVKWHRVHIVDTGTGVKMKKFSPHLSEDPVLEGYAGAGDIELPDNLYEIK
ncbi:hypothetical protein MASR2M17_21240 [Aminivibrio sp.]